MTEVVGYRVEVRATGELDAEWRAGLTSEGCRVEPALYFTARQTAA
jgi:hypothetical protein